MNNTACNLEYHSPVSKDIGTANPVEAVINRMACESDGGFLTSGALIYGGPDGETERFTGASPDLQTRSGLSPFTAKKGDGTQTVTEAITMTTVTTGTTTATTALVPVFTGTLQGQIVQLCDARTLHTFMVVLRDFSDWIKARIRKFGFVEGLDYLIAKTGEKVFPKSGENLGGRPTVDYHLTLDMAKELSMVENNVKGREARRYFMECEKQVLAALSTSYTLPAATPYSVQPTDKLSEDQGDTLRNMLTEACGDLAKDLHGMFMREGWSKLKSHFKVYYREIPQSQFNEAVSLLTRHIVFFNGTKVRSALQVLPAPEAPSLKNRRWLISFNQIDGREDVQLVPTCAFVMDAQQLCRAVQAGEFDGKDLMELACAVNQRQYINASNNPNKGYGEEVAAKIKDLGWADLNAINQRASMEVWARSMQLQKEAS